MFWNITQKLPKKWPKKNDNFSHFAKQRLISFVATPLLTKNFCFFKLSVLNAKTLMLNKKHNLKWGNSKDKIKELERKKDRKPNKEKILMKKKLAIEFFDVVPFMKEKQRRKKNKERDKNKEPKDSKKQRQEGRKKEKKKQERQWKRNTKRGRPKKAKGERKRNTENKQKMPFSRGKQGFLY